MPIHATCRVQGGAANDARVMPRKGSDVVVNRGVLASALVRACQERYPEAIHFHFGQALSGLDGQAWTARFVNAENEPGGSPTCFGFFL